MLKNIPLYSGLNEAEIAEIARHAVVRSYPKNTVLINEGDHSDTLYVIQEGKVKVYLADEQGKEIVLNQQGPGEYFGELTQHKDTARSAAGGAGGRGGGGGRAGGGGGGGRAGNPGSAGS